MWVTVQSQGCRTRGDGVVSGLEGPATSRRQRSLQCRPWAELGEEALRSLPPDTGSSEDCGLKTEQ